MASIFGHAVAALGMGTGFYRHPQRIKIWLLGVGSAMLPDMDVIGFRFGIAYESMWGHRGISHSLLFALIWSLVLMFIFFRKKVQSKYWIFLYLFLSTASHGVLDALTTGGKGVAFFAPWDVERYFFPWQFIRVSPLSISRFFSERGMAVIQSEMLYILIPSIIIGGFLFALQRQKNMKT